MLLRFGIRATRMGALLVSSGLLYGCTNPYGLDIASLDYAADQKQGTIQFSDPKLFPREHLINERRYELAFLDGQLAKCNVDSIAPEIIRELEVVRSIAAGVGLKFDPAAGAKFETESELAEIQNEITRTRLEMQLAQLQRDAELLQDQLAAQDTLVNQPGAADGTASATSPTSGVAAPTAEEIKALVGTVKDVINDLQADARAKISALDKSGGTAGPIETFNFRRACRDTVKSAINQTRLDELHDMDGNALVRLQLRATVLPDGDREYNDTLGILRMEMVPPDLADPNSKAVKLVYRNWLDHMNRNINKVDLADQKVTFRTNPIYLGLSSYFDLAMLEIPRFKDGKPEPGADKSCGGIVRKERRSDKCWYPRIALPYGQAGRLATDVRAADLISQQLNAAAVGIRENQNTPEASGFVLDRTCDFGRLDDQVAFGPKSVAKTARQTAYTAASALENWPRIIAAKVALSKALQSFSFGPAPRNPSNEVILSVLRSLESTVLRGQALYPASENVLRELKYIENRCFGLPVPPEFHAVIKSTDLRVAAYDVVPAERVQPVSTAARAADAVALAASIAGTLPTHGLGLSGNFAFSRSAVGKADALELAPIVVGFTEPVEDTSSSAESNKTGHAGFGWLLGPRIILKPEGQKLAFAHPVKPYELHADLSLPGWWPHFKIKAYSAWAPDWQEAGAGITMKVDKKKSLLRTVKVPMRHNSGDMSGLTSLLKKEAKQPSLDVPIIDGVTPNEVSACDGDIDFQIWGENVWRASQVHLGGRVINRDGTSAGEGTASAISVLPDMSGIVARVNISQLPQRRGDEATLTVWTSDGRDSKSIRFSDQLAADGSKCVKKGGVAKPEPKAPEITEVLPSKVFACAETVTFTVKGKAFGTKPLIVVGGAKATNIQPLPSKEGLTFDVKASDIASIDGKETKLTLTNEKTSAIKELAFLSDRQADGTCQAKRSNSGGSQRS